MNLINRSIAVAALMLGTSSVLAQTAATIPASMQGTYEVTFGSAQPGAPLTNGTTATMVIAPGGSICIAEYLFSNPVQADNSTAEAVYTSAALGLKLRLSDIQSGSFNELNVMSSSDAFLGQLSGSKVSNETSCAMLGGTPPDMSAIADIFKYAEQAYASLFPNAQVDNTFEIIDGFIARGYASTGTYIGIRNGTVYVLGGEFGNQPVTIGTVANTRAQLISTVTGEPVTPIEEPNVDIDEEGEYTLTIKGTYSTNTAAGPFTGPFEFSEENVRAPGSAEVDEIEDEVKKSMEKAVRSAEDDNENLTITFSNFEVSEVSVSDSRVFFRAKFALTSVQSNVPVLGTIESTTSYNVTYEYLK
ncbi:MAG TPA: hypothetical protein DEG76_14560 [Pseudohongiella sp.]|nr:hypothetical protein [Pseudohongiella sp.]HBX38425.1 hypothetical protein [Pseudohongiella sp.]|tara:strand:- start:163 stop:1242 length:1080 start_codon:yes stop_codon:yes gene_type:complete